MCARVCVCVCDRACIYEYRRASAGEDLPGVLGQPAIISGWIWMADCTRVLSLSFSPLLPDHSRSLALFFFLRLSIHPSVSSSLSFSLFLVRTVSLPLCQTTMFSPSCRLSLSPPPSLLLHRTFLLFFSVLWRRGSQPAQKHKVPPI